MDPRPRYSVALLRDPVHQRTARHGASSIAALGVMEAHQRTGAPRPHSWHLSQKGHFCVLHAPQVQPERNPGDARAAQAFVWASRAWFLIELHILIQNKGVYDPDYMIGQRASAVCAAHQPPTPPPTERLPPCSLFIRKDHPLLTFNQTDDEKERDVLFKEAQCQLIKHTEPCASKNDLTREHPTHGTYFLLLAHRLYPF